MDELQILRNELVNKVQELNLSYNDNIKEKFDKAVLDRLKDLRKLSINNDTILDGFCDISKKVIRNKLPLPGRIQIDNEKYILNFLLKGVTPQKEKRDYYALCAGYDGYNDFSIKNKVRKEKGKLESTTISSDEKLIKPFFETTRAIPLKRFFESGSYLYVYDDTITKPRKKTEIEETHYPRLDILVLEMDTKTNLFSIRNVDGKEDYLFGEISWCNVHYNSFDILFKNDERKLLLRFHLPYEGFSENEPEILFGKFSMALIKGHVISGSIVLENSDDKKKKTNNYSYKIGKEKNPEVKLEIKEYLFDRYKNWDKAPYNIYNFKGFRNWLDGNYKKDITKKRITEINFLITYPITSFDKESKINVLKVISEKLKSIDKKSYTTYMKHLLKNEDGKEKVEHYINSVRGYIKRKLKNKQIVIYPDSSKLFNQDERNIETQDLNRELFKYINKSLNVIFIYPEGGYKNPSSIFPLIGYSIALKKRTFILCPDKSKLPIILRKKAPFLELYVYQYDSIEQIPFLLNDYKFNDKRFKR